MRLGEEFLPNFQETDFLMHWVEKPGASLDAMRRITIQASNELRAIPGVRNFGSHIGRAEVADEVVGPNFTELWISVDPDVNLPQTVDQIQQVVDGYPGLYRDVLTYLKERIKEVLSGAGATIVVRTFGPDLDVLRAKGEEIKQAIADVPGVHQSQSRAAGAGAANASPPAARCRGRLGLTHGAGAPSRRDAGQRHKSRRDLSGSKELRRRRERRAEVAHRSVGAGADCRSICPRAGTCRWGTWPIWKSCRHRTRSSANRHRAGWT